jgi:hypothetical protein
MSDQARLASNKTSRGADFVAEVSRERSEAA